MSKLIDEIRVVCKAEVFQELIDGDKEVCCYESKQDLSAKILDLIAKHDKPMKPCLEEQPDGTVVDRGNEYYGIKDEGANDDK